MDRPLAFEITLHALPAQARAAGVHHDALGSWALLEVPRETLAEPLRIGCDEALAALDRLGNAVVEPDGSFVWRGPADGTGTPTWQVDGDVIERDGRVLVTNLRGSCPEADFDRLLAGLGWPGQGLLFQLVRPAVFLAETEFRRHARMRGLAGDGQTLRPD